MKALRSKNCQIRNREWLPLWQVRCRSERATDSRENLAEALGKTILKGTRWLILKNPENLNEDKGERTRLEEALRINQPLATAYYMKEEFRLFWEQGSLADATQFLDDWCRRAEASMVSVLQKMASTFQSHRTGLLNYHRCPISTGPLEGTNNKIKTMQRQAYGYRDEEFFKLRIYSIHLANDDSRLSVTNRFRTRSTVRKLQPSAFTISGSSEKNVLGKVYGVNA